jgi:uncharacterized protein YdhG (YjbR/CyaY superfamily)
MPDVDDYLASLPADARAAFTRVRDLALAELPEAAQGTSYGMAALTHRGQPVLGFRAAARHLSVFPFSPAALDAVRDQLDGFALSKGTVRFTANAPLPAQAVRDLVRHRVREIAGTTTEAQ